MVINEQNVDDALKVLRAAVLELSQRLIIEQAVSSGIAVALAKSGALDSVTVEIIRTAAVATPPPRNGEVFRRLLNERIDGLHGIVEAHATTRGTVPVIDA